MSESVLAQNLRSLIATLREHGNDEQADKWQKRLDVELAWQEHLATGDPWKGLSYNAK
jgi:hypothetical protein